MTNQQGAPEALYASAMEFAAEKASISYVQRKCRCSWNDAEQMLERMVREGIIATYNGRKSAALVEAQQRATHVQNPSEIEHVAGDVSKNGPESNMTAQPVQEGERTPVFTFPQAVPDGDAMALAESVGLIGPASRIGDLHNAIQRYHDLICVNATIKAAKMAADAIAAVKAQPIPVPENYPPLPMQFACSGVFAVYSADQMRAYVDADRAARTTLQPATADAVDALCDSQYAAGMLLGWNLCTTGDEETFRKIRGQRMTAALAAQRATHQGDHK